MCWSFVHHILLAPTAALVVMMVYYIYIYPRQLFQIFTQSIDTIDVTRVTLSCLGKYSKIKISNFCGYRHEALGPPPPLRVQFCGKKLTLIFWGGN